MDILEVVRRWQADESRRAVARGTGLARATVDKYVAAAERLGLAVGGAPPTEEQVLALVRLGRLLDPATGKRVTVWALILVLRYSRHGFVWPLVQQTLEEVVAGLEAAWRFFFGVPTRVVLDNFPAAVAGTDT